MMDPPKTPEGWASRLATLIYAVKDSHGDDRFPIRIREIAKDYSHNAFPDEPIARIDAVADCDGFEGMLLPIPGGSGAWGIIYNESGGSVGRVNFSIAHEFGHYLLHRQRFPDGKKCTNRDMLDWSSEEAQIEGEANRFAASILMPLDDFRKQVSKHGNDIDLKFFEKLKVRYEVSLSAAILRWLCHTNERAMIVVGRDGFIDWAWSSKPLLRSGVFYCPRQETIPLPPQSLAALGDRSFDNVSGVIHPEEVWLGNEKVKEMAVVYEGYGGMTISLLKYPKANCGGYIYEEPDVEDVADRFMKRFRGGGKSV